MKANVTRGLLLIAAALSLSNVCRSEELDFSRMAALFDTPVASAEPAELDLSRMAKLCEDCDCQAGCECDDGECQCGLKAPAKKFERSDTKQLTAIESALADISRRLDEIEKSCSPAPQIRLPEPATPKASQGAGYPVNSRTRWERFSGGAKVQPSKAELIQHLQTGEHAGKFQRAWLETLSLEELESLHTDDHEKKLKAHVQSPATTQTSSTAASNLTVVSVNGRDAVYRLEAVTRREKVCNGGVCTYRDVQTVRPVFVRWE